MEIIRLEGYTEDEKVEIAERHLVDGCRWRRMACARASSNSPSPRCAISSATTPAGGRAR
jgi:hypothetical protein